MVLVPAKLHPIHLLPSQTLGQKHADFQYGTIRVPLAPSLTSLSTVFAIKLGGGTHQFITSPPTQACQGEGIYATCSRAPPPGIEIFTLSIIMRNKSVFHLSKANDKMIKIFFISNNRPQTGVITFSGALYHLEFNITCLIILTITFVINMAPILH